MTTKLRKPHAISLCFGAAFLLLSCGSVPAAEVTVTLEQGDFHCGAPSLTQKAGSDFLFRVTTPIAKAVTKASYEDYSLSSSLDAGSNVRYHTLTFHNVRFSTVITLTVKSVQVLHYADEGGSCEEYAPLTHSRFNVSTDATRFQKEGHKLIGFTDEEGEVISLGSRVSPSSDGRIQLTPIYAKENPESEFTWEEKDSRYAKITGYVGESDEIVIPEKIEGHIIDSVAPQSFEDRTLSRVVLPRNLLTLSPGAFTSCHIGELVLFDGLNAMGDRSFANTLIDRVRINAAERPAYIGTYFGTYADKVDRLMALKDKKKVVLYSGSSTRFGFDSALIDETLRDRDVVNMGVYAYTESKPQIDVLSHFLLKEDVLIVAPEFDTLETQLNVDDRLDFAFFAMCEGNYDIVRLLPLDHYANFFDSFGDFLSRRKNMTRFSYEDSPSFYDEDGNRVSTASYNAYGDYALYRENNESRKSFGVRRAYYNKKYFPQEDVGLFVDAYAPLQERGVRVYFDYSPRMITSISEDSDEAARKELGEYLEQAIPMTFLSHLEESLLDPYYFYGTDNHLSTEGAKKRTQFVLKRLLPLL